MTTRALRLPSGGAVMYQWPWDGRQLLHGPARSPVAFDTETERIDESRPYSVPRLALATAASGAGAQVVRPEQLAHWVLAHEGCHLVGHNVVFDFWVVDEHLAEHSRRSVTAERARAAWRRAMTEGRLHDTMVLDQLVRLAAEGPRELKRRNLAVCCAAAGLALGVDKADPYRLRYGELIGADWSAAEAGFWDYAVRDAAATRLLWGRLARKAEALLARLRAAHGGAGARLVTPDCVNRFGPLTESLQVRGAAALWDAGRKGLRVDLPAARRFVDRLRNELTLDVAVIQQWAPEVFLYLDECGRGGSPKRSVLGAPLLPGFERELALTRKARTPRFKQKHLAAALVAAGRESAERAGERFAPPEGVDGKTKQRKPGTVSLSAKDWRAVAARHGGVKAWLGMTQLVKALGYAEPLLLTPEVHPIYETLRVTGRSSARNPNIQQSIKREGFREIFRPRAGFKLVTCDYGFIELRTLGAICEQRYGSSMLARVIREGRDPHSYTAAMFSGVAYEEIAQWAGLPEEHPGRKDPRHKLYKGYRQSSKVVNFGCGGGMGPRKLAAYAQESYGVAMTVEEARELRRRLVQEVYPELGRYLQDTLRTDLAWNLGLSAAQVAAALPQKRWFMRELSDAVEGGLEAVPSRDDARVWRPLEALAVKSNHLPPWARKAIRQRQGSEALWMKLFGGVAYTPTGRIASNRRYSQQKNYAFQSLAADGAFLALWALVDAGFRVVGFLHDEVLVEVPEAGAEAAAAEVAEVMNRSMGSVLMGVPSAVSAHVGDHWVK